MGPKVDEVVGELASLGRAEVIDSMTRFGITTQKRFGVSTPEIKRFAREVKKRADDRHKLALELWETGNFEARCVAAMIDDPERVTSKQMDTWAEDFDNWGTVDATCCYLFCHTPFAYRKATQWAGQSGEFQKRAAFALMAYLAIHDKNAPDYKFADLFLPSIQKHADDDRNFVKKAVNWALRQIGKRNLILNRLAIETAVRIRDQDTRSARWIASDAIRELISTAVIERLKKKS